MNKKFWTITGTNVFGSTKQELKKQRDELNRTTLGLTPDEKLNPVLANSWPHRITKGPEHPSVMPYFGELKLQSLFLSVGQVYKKTDRNIARTYNEGVLGLVNKNFSNDTQVSVLA